MTLTEFWLQINWTYFALTNVPFFWSSNPVDSGCEYVKRVPTTYLINYLDEL